MPSTWTSKAMWKAVTYAVILNAASDIAAHHLWDRAWYNNVPAELWFETTQDESKSNRDFYFDALPRDVILSLLLAPISYWWQCWLERMLPGRARGTSSKSAPSEKLLVEKPDVESDEELEEEIMRRLIAKGKVQRSTLSWFNTALKWLLDNIIAMEVFGLCASAFEEIWARQSGEIIWSNMKFSLLGTPLGHFLSLAPLISVLSFIVIPVQHRLTFAAATGLAFNVSLGAFVNMLIPWLMTKEWALDIMRNATAAASMAANNGTNGTVTWLAPTDGVSVEL